MAIFRELDERRGISIASAMLGRMEHDQGGYERAAALLTESVAVCRKLGERRAIPGLLRDLGAACRAHGDHRRAAAAFAESLTLAQSLDDQQGIAATLEHIAELLVQTGPPERAARLFGSAEVLREVAGQPRNPKHQHNYDRAVAAARDKLGETTFMVAWAAGRALALEQAITEAQEPAGGSRI